MVIVLTGAPGSGKSTVAGLLAARLDRAAHVPVDFFRKMIKGGYASPHHWSDEVDRQYRIARASAAQTAHNLAAGGFIQIGRAHVWNSSHLVISYAVFCLKKKKKP